jgi:hypothetical protein
MLAAWRSLLKNSGCFNISYMDPQPAYPPSNGGKQTLIIAALVLLLIGSLGFGYWAYSNGQDYKKNSDQKSARAVAQAEALQKTQLQAQFDEQSKSPTKTFTGSPNYGSVTFSYPKTWSAYVDTSNTGEPINGYFHPDIVPGTQSKTAYALRVDLLNSDYSQVVSQLTSNISSGNITSKSYLPPKLKGASNVAPGVYLSGHINPADQTQNGNMLIIKVRDKTLQIYTDSVDFQNDFNNIVLSSLTFAP